MHDETSRDRPPSSRSRRRSRPVLIALAIGAIVAGGAVWLNVLDPEWHVDGRGPLASLRGDGSIGMGATSIAQGEAVSFGLELCMLDDSTAVLESISPHELVGSGAVLVGARIRHLEPIPATGSMIGSVRGFPPEGYDPSLWTEAVGFRVQHRCEHPNPTAYTELIVGLKADQSDSGGWHGIDVAYQTGWRHRVLTVHYNLGLCRPDDPDCFERLFP